MDTDAIAAAVRTALADVAIREVRMFGGIGFMLNGNMLVATSKRGLLARVGKDARPGARVAKMGGRVMQGYVSIEPSALTKASVARWLKLARAFVETLPPKPKAAAKGRKS